MKNKISKNKNLLSITFWNIDYKKVLQLLKFLKVDNVSVFIDEGQEYSFKEIITIDDFVKHILDIKEPILIFDNLVTQCLMNEELEILSNKKILIDFNLGENMTYILINLNNANIFEEDVRKIMK